MTFILTRDIVIPAGTEVGFAPRRSDYISRHSEILYEIDKNSTATLRFDQREAIERGLIIER